MINKDQLNPLIKTLDKVILGIEEPQETDKKLEFIEIDTEEEFDVKRSIN
ncbi:hypothetical protein [Legionella drancourtii]|uniref:Uncharacterized protein n=1 Tax=Legionella drancourtii LLAP12 TaxID=658187 RepID=G9ETT8_9GAMM|nr:hypothetical protein [Legionella drancourtii]EHL29289.1 hypothetical protein LDG_8724 [Legionella drancourtii LLAP12]